MLILAFDTCTEKIDVALVRDKTLLGKRGGENPRRQLTVLIPYISEILRESNVSLDELDLISLTTGPGSFTGIRLGIATAKTLSQVKNIPISSVNTIDAIAWGSPFDGIVIPSMDARKGEIFFALYEKNKDVVKPLTPPIRKNVDGYINYLKNINYKNREITILGSVFGRYRDIIEESLNFDFKIPPSSYWTPKGEIIAQIGSKHFAEGKSVSYLNLSANYMRRWETTPPKSLI